MWIIAALVLVPIVEIALFVEIGGWLTLWPTLAIVVATAFLGGTMLRLQGRRQVAEISRRADSGEDVTPALGHAALLVVAGLLLLTPGFFTDGIGFALLFPPVRAALMARIGRHAVVVMQSRGMGRGAHGGPRRAGPGPTIETEYEDVTDRPEPGTRS